MTPTLYLLAAHATGDFLLQTDEMAENKFSNREMRVKHVLTYLVPFYPVAAVLGWGILRTFAFIAILGVTHYVIDSRRWNENVPIWYDQALHVIALAIAVGVASL